MPSQTLNHGESGVVESTPPADPSGFSRIYEVHKPKFQTHYKIFMKSDEPLFHVEITSAVTKKPELTLHAGSDQQAPVVAVCNFLAFAGSFKVGLGNPDDLHNVIWEDVIKQKMLHSQFRWEMRLESQHQQSPTATSTERRAFLWRRTHSIGVEGSKPSSLSLRSYKLIDEQTTAILAVFTNEKNLQIGGRLEIKVDYGRDFDKMVLITCLALYDKARRG